MLSDEEEADLRGTKSGPRRLLRSDRTKAMPRLMFKMSSRRGSDGGPNQMVKRKQRCGLLGRRRRRKAKDHHAPVRDPAPR